MNVSYLIGFVSEDSAGLIIFGLKETTSSMLSSAFLTTAISSCLTKIRSL